MAIYSIKKLSENDWSEYKSVRLKSLAESTEAFGSTYDREVSFTPEQWKARLVSNSTSTSSLMLAAISDQAYIGLLSGVIQQSDKATANLYQMWVSPKFRGLGVGTGLVNQLRIWAIENNAERLRLSVTTSNRDAVSLYQSLGFKATGLVELLRPGSTLESQEMVMFLDLHSNSHSRHEQSSRF